MAMPDPSFVAEPSHAESSFAPGSRRMSPVPGETRAIRQPASHGLLADLTVSGRSRSSSSASQQEAANDHANIIRTGGRTTLGQRRRVGKASLLANDARYKKFAAQVDRCLHSFDSVNEWADFISFLSRLLKTLQAPSPLYAEIPRKLTVAKRLAQCLNPALPSGVHQRALDVYAFIFSSIGSEGLKRDILIWSSGLFPFFQFAATSVRPLLINIYETFYLPLNGDLRPATKALILALLPGLEEETGDFFDRILAVLDRLSEAVSVRYFTHNIFLVLISSPASRLSALNYLSRRMLKPPDTADMPVDTSMLLRGVTAVLEDDNSLVRRSGLDLLVRILPLDGDIIRQSEERDRQSLMRATIAVVLQREISLSRRVYAWLLGGGDTAEARAAYLKMHGLDLLAETLQIDMASVKASKDLATVQRPFKVFLSLLDKWEVGSALSEWITIPALIAIKGLVETSELPFDELVAIAAAVIEAVEPIIIWRTFYTVLSDLEGNPEAVDLTIWLLRTIIMNDEEVLTIYTPLLLQHVVAQANDEELLPKYRSQLLDIALLLLKNMPERIWTTSTQAQGEKSMSDIAAAVFGDPNVVLEAIQALVGGKVLPDTISKAFNISQQELSTSKANPRLILQSLDVVSRYVDLETDLLKVVDVSTWFSCLRGALESTSSFAVADAIVTIALKASHNPCLLPHVSITDEATMNTILDAMFRFLRPDAAPHHVRAVELLWKINQRAPLHTLESVISHRMAAQGQARIDALHAFGVLWRLTDDALLPGDIFYVPICRILDALASTDPVIQATAETWMRCNIKSYFRVLDPLLARLLAANHHGKDGVNKAMPDVAMFNHLVVNITALFRFGAGSLSRICRDAVVQRSNHAVLRDRASTLDAPDASYLEVWVRSLVRSLNSDVTTQARIHNVEPLLLRLRTSELDLLHMIVVRGDVSRRTLSDLGFVLLQRLDLMVESGHLVLQGRTLHLLHAVLTITAPNIPRSPRMHRKSLSATLSEKSLPVQVNDSMSDGISEAVVQAIIKGISSSANRPVLQHWVDFVLMAINQLQWRRESLIAICDCCSLQLRHMIVQMRDTYVSDPSTGSKSALTAAEPIMLMNVLERLLALFFGEMSNRRSEGNLRSSDGGNSFLGLVSGVFVAEVSEKDNIPSHSDDPEHSLRTMEALLLVWTVTSTSPNGTSSSGTQYFDTIRSRTRMMLERLYRARPSVMITGIVKVWSMRTPDLIEAAICDCIDMVAPSAQKVVEIISDAVGSRLGRQEPQCEPYLMAFLEAYLSRLEAPIAVQVWPTTIHFAREALNAATTITGKIQMHSVLRCLTILAKTVSATSALDDRRMRRELQDVYAKILDVVVANAARIAEGSIWRGQSRPGGPKGHAMDADGDRLNVYLAEEVIPHLRSFLLDNDKINTACVNISTGIIVPAFRQQQVDQDIFGILNQIANIPSATKAWRLQVSDAFNSGNFFRMDPQSSPPWRTLICSLMNSDKERFAELLSRITAAPSANIFTNREQEMISRSLNLRRLSFVLLAAERNHYLTQLPNIQEKLVEILRTDNVSPRVHSEVYLCLRVLMCRISGQHLTNFWPVILAELLSVFEATMIEPPSDNSEALQLVLAACKFLDLLLVIQSEDFQVHQWMFVTDTTDAAYPPEDHHSEAIMDQLSDILAEHAHKSKHVHPALLLDTDNTSILRRPRLAAIKSISGLYQLQPFFARASMDTFEGVYNNAGVDWEAVEDGLSSEIFEGSMSA